MGPLTDVEAGELTEQLLQVSNSDDPPTLEVHPYILEQTCRQLAMRGPPRAIEAMLRNTKQIKTTHDLRAWCWQCIWAMRNRTGLPSPQP